MKNLELIKNICLDCLKEGEAVLSTKWLNDRMGSIKIANPTAYVEIQKFKKWKSNCNVLLNLLGDLAKPWIEGFRGDKVNTMAHSKEIMGMLGSICETIEKGYLIKYEDLIFTEAFSNLIEQAEYLFGQGYILASGVITRAVLEEKLKNLCLQQNIAFTKTHPTLSDYNQELYKSNYYSKIEFKNIDHLISIGNNAAHNAEITKEDIAKLLEGVKSVLNKYI